MEVRGNLWLQGAQGLMLGKGRAMLLRQIEETGSIAEAARQMEMSYRRAWGMVKAMNEAAETPLVEKNPGGKKGGGASLTAEGRKLLESFEQLMEDFQQFQNNYNLKNNTVL